MSQKSYRQAKASLNEILEKLQDPKIDLDEAIELHKKGKELLTFLEEYLEKAGEKISSEIEAVPKKK